MRRFLDDRKRQRAASLLVVLYTLCVIGPATAIAFSDDATAAHCLTDDHHETVKVHVHQGRVEPSACSAPGDDQGQAGKCCGLFGPSTIAPTIDFVVWRQPHTSHLASVFAGVLSGRGSDRVDRPPKSLLPLRSVAQRRPSCRSRLSSIDGLEEPLCPHNSGLVGRCKAASGPMAISAARRLSAGALLAQGCAATPPRPFDGAKVADPGVRVPPAAYRPVLGNYSSQRPVEPSPWRERNDRVAPTPKKDGQ